ncbi:hypothetical protein ACFLQ0_00620 [Nitrospinota bacterium]
MSSTPRLRRSEGVFHFQRGGYAIRKVVVFLLVMALALIAVPRTDAAKNTVTIALTGEPTTMDPHRTSNFIGGMVWRWSYDTIVSLEAGTEKIKPWLAEKWEKLDGTKKVKFWIRKNACSPTAHR